MRQEVCLLPHHSDHCHELPEHRHPVHGVRPPVIQAHPLRMPLRREDREGLVDKSFDKSVIALHYHMKSRADPVTCPATDDLSFEMIQHPARPFFR